MSTTTQSFIQIGLGVSVLRMRDFAPLGSSRKLPVLVYTAIFEKNMRNSTVNYLIPDWLTAVT